uniref:OSCP1 n=1 Tax=Acrobeloides nanus TaxID=290746 RepID=A0A914D024_9BILA
MGGEMSYILEQRLQAQNVGEEKSNKVLHDIMAAMFSKKFLDVLFRPQEMYSRGAMRQFFEKIAHSSIMRLNEASMDKLFDLMTMAVKYQLQLARSASDLMLITLNHLDGIRDILKNATDVVENVNYAHKLMLNYYAQTPIWEMTLIRNTMMSFFQDARVKVSVMLREKRQLEDGRFLLFGDEIELQPGGPPPGIVRYIENGEIAKFTTFNVTESFVPPTSTGNTEIGAEDRGTKLGENIYRATTDSTQVKGGGGLGKVGGPPAGDELKLLTKLIARDEIVDKKGFDLSLFADEFEEKNFAEESSKHLQEVNRLEMKDKRSLNKALQEMSVNESNTEERRGRRARGEDMLSLLDEAATKSTTTTTRNRSGSAKGSRPRSSSIKKT